MRNDNGDKDDCECLGPNVFKRCKFPGVQRFYDEVIDQPAPEKPVEPDPPTPEAFEQYRQDLDVWSEEFKDYRVNYDRAIAEAEGNIDGLYENFGQAFKVSVTGHWIVMTVYNAIVLGLILMVQKIKDIF